jgi:hypothetical protein
MHGIGVLAPVAEVVCVGGELLAKLLDRLSGLVEEDLKRVSM